MMPELNGDEVLRLIRSRADTRDIPVVMISADTDTDKISKCIELGADDYLPKPFNPTILRARIGSALRRNSLRTMEADYLSRVEKQKGDSEALLRNFLPAEIAFRLRNGESNIADHYDDATVLFADIVGFGKITARMKAFEIIECLNHLFSEFDRLAEACGVEKIKTSGDNYMAVAGIPRLSVNHAQTATKLALAMIEAARQLHLRLPEPFSIRVGLHSGPVMAGVIGTRKFSYDVWGDAVNIAARLEAASQPNRVLISASTASAVGNDFVSTVRKKFPPRKMAWWKPSLSAAAPEQVRQRRDVRTMSRWFNGGHGNVSIAVPVGQSWAFRLSRRLRVHSVVMASGLCMARQATMSMWPKAGQHCCRQPERSCRGIRPRSTIRK